MSVGAISGSGYLNASFNATQASANTGATKDNLSALLLSLSSQDPLKARGVGTLINKFDTIDLNHSGSLDASELAVYKKTLTPPDRRILGDGVTKEQLNALDGKVKSDGGDDTELKQLISSFDQADTNLDGKVDAKEIDALTKNIAVKERANGQDSSGTSFISPKTLEKLLKRYQLSLTATPAASTTSDTTIQITAVVT